MPNQPRPLTQTVQTALLPLASLSLGFGTLLILLNASQLILEGYLYPKDTLTGAALAVAAAAVIAAAKPWKQPWKQPSSQDQPGQNRPGA